MAFYYVKSGGTATGDGGRVTTQRTGAWSGTASEYYDTLADALSATTPEVDGDFILVSHLHNEAAAVSFLSDSRNADGAGVQLISVDNANQENYKPGASEVNTEAVDSQLYGNWLWAGFTYEMTSTTNIIRLNALSSRQYKFIDCTLKKSTTELFDIALDGEAFTFVNCDLDWGGGYNIENGNSVKWFGGAWVQNSALFGSSLGVNGGAYVYYEGIDLSVRDGSIFGAALSATTVGVVKVEFVKCRLHASVTLPADSDLTLPQHIFIMRGCDDSTGGDTFRFHYQTGTGKAVNNESTFVTGEKAWGEPESPEKRSSIEITTKSNCSHILPFVFDFNVGQEYIDLADAAENVLRLPILSELTLTDTEIAAFMMYPDGTTAVTPVWITSGKVVSPTGSPEQRNYGVDPLAAGTELPTQSPETQWTIGGGSPIPNRYYLELDTSAIAGQAQAVSVRIEVYRASISAGELFIATEFEKL